MNEHKNTVRGSLLLLLTSLIWGVAFVAQRVGMDYVGPYTFNGVRFLIGALTLLPFACRIDRHHTETKKADRTLLKGGVVCGFFLCTASMCQQYGLLYSSVGKAGFITAFYIILVPVISFFLYKKRSSFKLWIAVAMGLTGLYLLCMTDGFSLQKGDILLLACALLFSFQILAVEHYGALVSGVKLSMLQNLFTGIICMICAFIFEQPDIADLLNAWPSILYAGILSCGVAYTLQIIGQKDLDPTVASLIMSLESSISALAGWFILGQTLSPRELSGCAIMFAAIIIAQL